MSHSVPEADDFQEVIPCPDILDTTYPTSVADAITKLANRTRNLAITLGKDTTTIAPLESVAEGDVLSPDSTGTAPFLVPTIGRADWFRSAFLQTASKIVGMRNLLCSSYDEQVSISSMLGGTHWAADFGASIPGISQSDVAFAYSIVYPIPARMNDPTLTFGSSSFPRSIRAVRARVGRLSGAAHSAMPTTKRILDLCYTDLYAGTPAIVVVASISDPAAAAGPYDTFHDITLSLTPGQASITDATRMWFVRLQGETGSNSVVGHGLIDLRVAYTLT